MNARSFIPYYSENLSIFFAKEVSNWESTVEQNGASFLLLKVHLAKPLMFLPSIKYCFRKGAR
jgi:hypothetical protein